MYMGVVVDSDGWPIKTVHLVTQQSAAEWMDAERAKKENEANQVIVKEVAQGDEWNDE